MSLRRRLPLWTGSLLVVLGAHAGVAFWSLYWKPAPLQLEAAPAAALLIELAPGAKIRALYITDLVIQ